jgi:hypothetical protein
MLTTQKRAAAAMEDRTMRRRQFLKLLAMVCTTIMVFPFRRSRISDEMSMTRSFYIAGVRFNPTLDVPKTGDRVLVKRSFWNGEKCYAIYTEGGQQIGYLPRHMIPVFGDLMDQTWRLTSVNPETVPWKRYRIGSTERPRGHRYFLD